MRRAVYVIFIFFVNTFISHAALYEQLDLENLDEETFLEYFGLPAVDDPEEFKEREEALIENIAEIEEINEGYKNGEFSWFDAINEYDDLPEDEFVRDHTGVIVDGEILGTGILPPTPEERTDEFSEVYFDQFRYESEDNTPAYYNSRDLGHVSTPKSQGSCGSCAVFATVGAIETCLARVANATGDYSEQQLMDCGMKDGCRGAAMHSYGLYLRQEEQELLAHESYNPYMAQAKECKNDLPNYNMGAKIAGFYYTYRGDEELMKKMVVRHGAVMTNMNADFKNYDGGIYSGCRSNFVNHAVVVVGYGTENGKDYWIVKNSWGPNWAENGFIRLERGVTMCGISQHMAVFECEPSTEPTDAPLPEYCEDIYEPKVCAKKYFEKDRCNRWKAMKNCRRTCGLCPN